MNTQPSRRSSENLRALQDVLDLGREVEGQPGKLGVHGAHHGQRVSRSVQEIRVAEGDVGRPFVRELPDIVEDDILRHHEEAAAIDRRDRTVQAEVQAAAACFHVADQLLPAVLVQMRVLLESRQGAPARPGEGQPLQNGPGRVPSQMHSLEGTRASRLHRLHHRDQRRLVLATDHRIAAVLEEVVGIQRRVETIEADVAAWIHAADLLCHADPQPERGVHGHGDRHEAGMGKPCRVERLDRDVERFGRVAGALEESQRRGEGQRLVAQLIAGDEEDRPLVHLSGPWR